MSQEFLEKFAPRDRFINRELSWLAFNDRVLAEAKNTRHPLLERVRFLAISHRNLDEFFMVRIAGIKGLVQANVSEKSVDGLSPEAQLAAVTAAARILLMAQQEVWQDLQKKLKEESIDLVEAKNLTKAERAWLDQEFQAHIFPVLTPLAIDPAHPFPFIPNGGFAMLLRLREEGAEEDTQALIPIPAKLARFIGLCGGKERFILLEKVIPLYFSRIFPNFKIHDYGMFRIIRDGEIEVSDKAEDLVKRFKTALQKRRRGNVIALFVEEKLSNDLCDFVAEEYNMADQDIYVVDGFLGLSDIQALILPERADLQFVPYRPRYPERISEFKGDCFKAIESKDLIVHHPYESFDVVVDFLNQAARDPDVLAIKQTLYRSSPSSPIVKALIEAAEAGKAVTALIELKARFDEETNIDFARELERAGAQVAYGFMDLKTHAKISMVVRRERGDLVTYVHFGTGNYHPANARVYTDLSFFTSDPALARDAASVFNYLTGYAKPTALEKISIAPLYLRQRFLGLIEKEIGNTKKGKPAQIWAKMNALVDPIIIDKLYEASQAGVEVDLIVRGICCLRPGVTGLSENIRVKSIVGRFLEHARIYAFANGHKMPNAAAKVFISSADWMPRNLDYRVEVLIPIENPTVHRQVLDQIMVANLSDNTQSFSLGPDHSYHRLEPGTEKPFTAHQYFMTNPSLSGRGSALLKEAPPDKIES